MGKKQKDRDDKVRDDKVRDDKVRDDQGSGEKVEREARPTLEQIADEHRALAESVTRLEKTTDPHQILPRLEKLKSQLEHHFQSEEGTGGVRDDVTRHAAYLLPSLQKIFAEHRQFLAEIDELHAKTRTFVEGPLAEILDQATGLCRHLRDHEAREAELLSDVYYTDYGSAD